LRRRAGEPVRIVLEEQGQSGAGAAGRIELRLLW